MGSPWPWRERGVGGLRAVVRLKWEIECNLAGKVVEVVVMTRCCDNGCCDSDCWSGCCGGCWF